MSINTGLKFTLSSMFPDFQAMMPTLPLKRYIRYGASWSILKENLSPTTTFKIVDLVKVNWKIIHLPCSSKRFIILHFDLKIYKSTNGLFIYNLKVKFKYIYMGCNFGWAPAVVLQSYRDYVICFSSFLLQMDHYS